VHQELLAVRSGEALELGAEMDQIVDEEIDHQRLEVHATQVMQGANEEFRVLPFGLVTRRRAEHGCGRAGEVLVHVRAPLSRELSRRCSSPELVNR
jgi:hypothetical protein